MKQLLRVFSLFRPIGSNLAQEEEQFIHLEAASISIDNRRLAECYPWSWRVVCRSAFGGSQSLPSLINWFSKGPYVTFPIHYGFQVDAICVPTETHQHGELRFQEVAYRKGTLSFRTIVRDDVWRNMMDIMRRAFRPGVFKETGPCTFSLDIRLLLLHQQQKNFVAKAA